MLACFSAGFADARHALTSLGSRGLTIVISTGYGAAVVNGVNGNTFRKLELST